MTPVSGRLGKVTVGVTDLCITSWEVDEEGEELDTTCTDGTGKNSSIVGTAGVTLNVKANYDADAPPFAAPPGLIVGDLVAVKAYVGDPVNNKFWNFPTMRITNVKNQSEVKGLVTYEFTGKSSGAYTRPT